jgi:peptidoglycan/xylan/chitin deacetylase (PgdA/CDA1 family)
VHIVSVYESLQILMKHRLITAGLAALQTTGLTRLASRWTRGLGAILMFHHVRPSSNKRFNPFQGLEITPDFLDAVVTHLKKRGYEIIPIAEMRQRVKEADASKPFAVLTFDDGYKDNVEFALPILKRHQAPFTVFATTGFADGTAPLWWLEIADAVASGRALHVGSRVFSTQSDQDKIIAFDALAHAYREQPGMQQAQFVRDLVAQSGIEKPQFAKELCLDWNELRQLSEEPLCTIGAHTATHPLLAKMPSDVARAEMEESKSLLEKRLGCSVAHIAYPVGDKLAAAEREFQLAAEIGYETAVTTRPGMIFSKHLTECQALPRLSVNGLHQSIPAFDALLSGLPFALLNKVKALRG